MHNPISESIIGRHGLVSEGFLLWKVGVKNVYNYTEKLVDFHPHNPQRHRGKRLEPTVVPIKKRLYPEDTPLQKAVLSTPKNTKTTDQNRRFYPVSTEPITTITTYINRRGTHA